MEDTPGDQSEIIIAQQAVIAQQAKLIEQLTRRLATRWEPRFSPMPEPWLEGLTRAQAALLVLLRDAYPRILTRDFLMDHVPGRDERMDRSMDSVVKQCRRRLGKDCVVTEYGLGYRMGPAFHQRIAAG